jgi:hypothetical protein
MSLLRKTPALELNNYTHLLQVNENYLKVCMKESHELLSLYAASKISFEVLEVKQKYLQSEIKDTEKTIKKYKAKIEELNLLINKV